MASKYTTAIKNWAFDSRLFLFASLHPRSATNIANLLEKKIEEF